MLETPHVALGIAIATKIPNPYVSIPLAFASHFLLDMVPHWNPHLNTETKKFGRLTNKTLTIIALDLSIAAIFTILAMSYSNQSSLNILLCSLAAVLPDVVEGPYYIFGIKNKFLGYWIKFQKSIQADANIFWGNLTQVIVLILCSLYIFS